MEILAINTRPVICLVLLPLFCDCEHLCIQLLDLGGYHSFAEGMGDQRDLVEYVMVNVTNKMIFLTPRTIVMPLLHKPWLKNGQIS